MRIDEIIESDDLDLEFDRYGWLPKSERKQRGEAKKRKKKSRKNSL